MFRAFGVNCLIHWCWYYGTMGKHSAARRASSWPLRSPVRWHSFGWEWIEEWRDCSDYSDYFPLMICLSHIRKKYHIATACICLKYTQPTSRGLCSYCSKMPAPGQALTRVCVSGSRESSSSVSPVMSNIFQSWLNPEWIHGTWLHAISSVCFEC